MEAGAVSSFRLRVDGGVVDESRGRLAETKQPEAWEGGVEVVAAAGAVRGRCGSKGPDPSGRRLSVKRKWSGRESRLHAGEVVQGVRQRRWEMQAAWR